MYDISGKQQRVISLPNYVKNAKRSNPMRMRRRMVEGALVDYHVLIWILMSIHVVSNIIYIFTCNIIYYLSNLILNYIGVFVVVHILSCTTF